MRLYLVGSGSGYEYEIRDVKTFDEATTVVVDLDRKFNDWGLDGCPKLPSEDPLIYWEGCDIYVDRGSVTYRLNNDAYMDFDGSTVEVCWERLK